MRNLALALAASTFLVAPAFAGELLTNGNFETGSYSGWTANVASGANGNLFISTPGTSTPISGFSTPANPAGGNYYSVTDQSGPGAYSLTQAFTVGAGTTSLALTFQAFISNNSGITAGSDFNFSSGANEHAQVDILNAGADPFTSAPGDIVQSLFYSGTSTGWTDYSFDLSSLAAGNYLLRFGEVDNQGFFNFGVDNVSLQDTAAVPEPASWAMMVGGFGLIGGALRRKRTAVRFV